MKHPDALKHALLLFVSIFPPGCEKPTLEEVPAEVIGRWTTTDIRYADRAFEITPETVYLHQGGDQFAAYAILRARITVSESQAPTHSVQYRDESGEEYSFAFYVSDEDGGSLRFINQQKIVWHRNPDARVPWDVPQRGR